MTDKTDIAALRSEACEISRLFEAERFIEKVIGLLEAERQRADELQAEQKQHDAQIEQMEGKIQLLTVCFRLKTKHCEKANAELAALKGEPVPVGIVRKVQQGLHVTLYQSIPEGTELFTAPQKPVVHPDTKRMDWLCAHALEVRDPQMYGSHAMFHAQQDSEEWDLPHHTTLREQVDAAIEAAGGIVKDGE